MLTGVKYIVRVAMVLFSLQASGQPDLVAEAYFNVDAEIEILGRKVLFDSNNEIVVLANAFVSNDKSEWDLDIILLKYASDGTPLWKYRYDNGTGLIDWANDMIIDSENNILVVGTSYTKYQWDWDVPVEMESRLMVLKFSPKGDLLWRYGKIGIDDTENRAVSVTQDTNDNIYVTGVINYGVTNEQWPFHPKMAIIKLDKDGVEKWSDSIDEYAGKKIAFVQNEIQVVGTSGVFKTSISRYDLYGNLIASNEYMRDNTSGSFSIDAEGNVYFWGRFGTGLVKYDRFGKFLWEFSPLSGFSTPISYERVNDLDFDTEKNIYLTGEYYNDSTHNDMVTIKIDSNGNEIWRIEDKNQEGYTSERGKHIQSLTNGNILVAGEWQKGEGRSEYKNVIRYIDDSGETLWEMDTPYAIFPYYGSYSVIHKNYLYTSTWEKPTTESTKHVLRIYGLITGIVDTGGNMNTIFVYPNPASSSVYIVLPDKYNEYQIRIFDSMGRKVFNKKSSGERKVMFYFPSFLNPGMYFIEVISNNQKLSAKFIVK